MDDKLVHIEAILDLLECKLNSVPAEDLAKVDGQASQVVTVTAESTYVPAVSADANNSDPSKAAPPAEEVDPEKEKEKKRAELYKDDQIKTFAKMLKFGVPEEAIRAKMQSIDYDPAILDVIFDAIDFKNLTIENHRD